MASHKKPDQAEYYDRAELERVDHQPSGKSWFETPSTFTALGSHLHPAKPKNLEVLGLGNAHNWSTLDEDWKLPEGWKDTVIDGMRERLGSPAPCAYSWTAVSGAVPAPRSVHFFWAAVIRRTCPYCVPNCCDPSIGATSPKRASG